MQYPLISEYLAAIREAKDNLDTLSHLVPVLDKYGEPYRSSGAFAVVFKMKDEQTGKCYALKCFTEEQEGRAEAYRQIAEELEFVDSPYITSVKYLEKELFVDSNCEDEEFPVLLMDWIEGETMETYIAANYTDTHAMSMLCYRFCKMAAWLRSQSFAHGDIKPDNIMVRSDGTLTLVDYDGMFVPAMKGQKSPTIGTKDFSHPLRTIDDFDDTIDDFALASIALSLKAISLNPSLLQTYGASDRLLFSAADYLDLSKSKTFTALQSLLADEEAKILMSMFLLACAQKNLSMCSFRLFDVQKPKEEVVWSTEVTKEDLENAVEDEFGVKYSKDWKRLLKAPQKLEGEYYIKKGVKVIGNYAFAWCYSLTNINIQDGVTSIGDYAFIECRSLRSINIPNSVTNIGTIAFGACNALTSINIPNSVKTIGAGAFFNCKFLKSITIPSSVIAIGDNPFCGCYADLYNESKAFIYEHNVLFNKDKTTIIAYRAKKTNYIIPDSVTSILGHAFSGCSFLTRVDIPDSVTTIGSWAFMDCNSLISINIPNSVTTIGNSAFSGCNSLSSINIPNSVTTIGSRAFEDCNSLTIINIPNSVTTIGSRAFERCKLLTNINIPNSVTTIENDAFCVCHSLISINIPNSVTTIGSGVFCGCDSLTNINIPNSVTTIGDSAFCGCDSLTNINIPNSVTTIGSSAFQGCDSLTNINIPNNVTTIGNSAFRDCKSLTSINIPNSVTTIGDNAFQGCKSLTSINIPNSVTTIESHAFEKCNSLVSVNIPNSVTTIRDSAFKYCKSLTSINIPNSVTTIESRAFEDCNNIPFKIKSDIIQRFGNEVFELFLQLPEIFI